MLLIVEAVEDLLSTKANESMREFSYDSDKTFLLAAVASVLDVILFYGIKGEEFYKSFKIITVDIKLNFLENYF